MPIITSGLYTAPLRTSNIEVDPLKAAGAVNYVTTQDRNSLVTLGGVAALGAVDLFDTVASSIPGLSKGLGIERGDLNNRVVQALDIPGVKDFWHDYKGGIEAASGIGGIVAAELVTRRLTTPAGAFMTALAKIPYARRVAALDAQYANAMQTVRAVDKSLAARGALGLEQYVGKTVVDSNIFDVATGAFIANGTKEVARSTAVSAAKGLGALKGIRNAAFTEVTMGLTLNQNDFLYDDSAAQNMTWMGLGLGVAGAAEWLHGAYQIRKFVNSDEIRRSFVGALDPGGQEESRLLWHGKKLDPKVQPEGFLGGIFTDRATNLFVNAKTLTDKGAESGTEAAMLMANRSRLATQQMQQGKEELQKTLVRGISSDSRTGFSFQDIGFGNHADLLTYNDPAWAYGVEQIGAVFDETTAGVLHEKHVTRLSERMDEVEEQMGSMLDEDGTLKEGADAGDFEKLQGLARRLDYEGTLTPMAAIDGELMPLSEAEAFAGFIEPEIKFNLGGEVKATLKGKVKGAVDDELKKLNPDKHGFWEAKTENPKGNVTLGSDFLYHIPGNKKLANADMYDVLRLYRLGDAAITSMSKFQASLPLPNKPDWFQLDMAEELLRRTGGRARVKFPEGMTRESARQEALLQKSALVKQWDQVESKAAMKAESAGNTYEGQLSKLRLRLNLPRMSAYERGILGDETTHPVEALLRGMAQVPEAEVRAMNMSDVRETMAKFKRIGDMAPVQNSDMEDMGKSFSFMKDDKGRPVKPLLVYKRPFKVAEWTSEHNAERLAAAKMQTLTELTSPRAAPMTRNMSTALSQSPDMMVASKSHELMDNQIQGSLAGKAPQTQAGAFGKAFITSEWRDRDNPILLAATRVREGINRMARDFMKSAIDAAFEGNLARLSNPQNATSKLLLNNFHSFRPGWDIATNPVKRDDGFYSFILKETEDNRERFMQQYGRQMPKGQSLLSPNGKEVVLDQLGLELQQRFNGVTNAIRDEKNTLLRANFRGEIDTVDWYVPPVNTDGKIIGFTFGPDNVPIPGMTVVAKTEQEFALARDEMLKRIDEKGLGYTFRTQEEVREFANIWDKVQMDFMNPGTTAIQPGKRSRGALTGSVIRSDAFAESLQHLQDDFLRHSNDVVETMFREQINSSKARATISSDMTRNMTSSNYDAKSRNVYDFYIENLTGRSKLNSKGSMVGQFYRSIEGPLDKWLAETTPGVSRATHAMSEWVGQNRIWRKDEQARKDFNALSKELGEYMPFNSANEMIRSQGLGTVPITAQAIAGKVNAFSAAVLLRIAEVAHPIMNLAGMLNASPSVIRSFQPRVGESTEDFARRVGHSANIFEVNGQQIGVLDMAKISGRAIKRAWSRESHPDYDYMVRRGFLSQEVAEFHRQFGAIETPGSWDKFFNGDPSATSRLSPTGKDIKSKGVVGWMSVLSDKSEDFSRSWAHMTGLELADAQGIKGLEARHSFAHDVANKMIANYTPSNRPEVFQGALGSTLGLFQSFMLNYYQRMFRYVETKDYKSLVTQMTTQSALFGVSSLPGWQVVNGVLGDQEEGDNAESAMYRRLGKNGADLLSHGTLSNLPKIFGGDGVDLYSRGDVAVRQAQIQDMDSISGIINATIPAMNVVGKVYNGLTQAAGLFLGDNPGMSKQQFAEVFSNMMANRPVAGLIEQTAAGGKDVDRSGQLVSETRTALEMTYRLLGVRSMRQSEELRAFYQNKNAQTHKAANDEQLKLYTRSLMREGRFEEMPEVFNQYLKNGGDPRHFRRWMKTTYIAATSTRGQRQLEDAMKNPQKMEEVLRLLDAGVSVNDDEAVEPDDQLYVANQEEAPLTQQPVM